MVEDRPPLNLVFLIDTSGSMNQSNKLPLLKQSLALMLSKLTAQDQVAIVTYAGSAGQVLAPTAGDRTRDHSGRAWSGWMPVARPPGRPGCNRPMRWPMAWPKMAK